MYAYLVLRIYCLYYLLLLCHLVVYCVTRLLIPPNKSVWFRDPTAQMTDGGIHSSEPSFLSSIGLTPRRVVTAWAQHTYTQQHACERVISSSQRLRKKHTTNQKHNRRTSTPSELFKPAIPAIKGLQTYALYPTATGMKSLCIIYT